MALELTLPKQGAALIFGGSGGVGKVISATLAQAGSSVAIGYFSGVERAANVVTAIRSQNVECSSHAVDVRDHSAVHAMVNEVAEQHGGIHTVICSAGSQIAFKSLLDLSADKWHENINTDLHGTFNIVQAVIPHLRKSQGSFTALSTMAYHRILMLDGVSACPKAAVETLVRQMACEEGMHGVRANSVALGAINAGMGSIDSDSSIIEEMGQEAIDAICAMIRLGGRLGLAEEVANVVAFLSSQQASYVTGQTVVVDGGATL